VLAGSGFIVKSAHDFDQKFEVVRQPVQKGTKVDLVEQTPIEDATKELQNPAKWTVPKAGSSLFVSEAYMVENGELKRPEGGTAQTQSRTKDPIPNQWFFENKMSPFKTGVNREDPDGDGFWNEEEWIYKTDPNDKTSHPPYYTRLFFVKYIKVPFLLRFQALDGDPLKDKPENLSFQINTLSVRQPTQFLKLGDQIPKTKFKVEKFEYKMAKTASDTDIDVSELTLLNTETGASVVLVMNKITDSPDSYAHFHFFWPDPKKGIDISVRKGFPFHLPPEKEVEYKLLDIDDTKAVIQLPSGEKLEIFPAPPGYP
jgi:hypothetical protein